jgi:uncharacterized protein YndB with AHSA1/START domain
MLVTRSLQLTPIGAIRGDTLLHLLESRAAFMPLQFRIELTIARQVPDVFSFVSDPTHLPMWNYYIVETTQDTPGAPQIGTRYTQRRKTDTQHFEIVEWEHNRRVAIQLLPPTWPVQIAFTFHPHRAGTRLEDEWSLHTPMPVPGFIAGFITRPIQRAVAENLGRLKELLETGRATLQDGRIVEDRRFS